MSDAAPPIEVPATSTAADRLFNLLPELYRQRDLRLGDPNGPLRDFLTVVGETVEEIENDIAGLYDNLFVETCEPWVLSYLGALIGYRAGDPVIARTTLPARVRADVADTLRQRQRKGTLPLLEEIARRVTGWPALASEPLRLLAAAEAVNHFPTPERTLWRAGGGSVAARGTLPERGTIDVRSGDGLDRLQGPFDDSAVRLACVRPVTSFQNDRKAERNRYLRHSATLAVWPLQTHFVPFAPAHADDRSNGQFRFSILNHDVPLLVRPHSEPDRFHIADETNLPVVLRRRALFENKADWYGKNKSFCVWKWHEPLTEDYGFPTSSDEVGPLWQEIPMEKVVAADLSQWGTRPQSDEIAVDPELGRIQIGDNLNGDEYNDGNSRVRLAVSFHHAFAPAGFPIGGGGYVRPVTPLGDRVLYSVGRGQDYDTLGRAVDAWRLSAASSPDGRKAMIEIRESGVHEISMPITLSTGDDLEIRAASGCRPVLRVLDNAAEVDALRIIGLPLRSASDSYPPSLLGESETAEALPVIRFDGLLIAEKPVRVMGRFAQVAFVHCTLLPRGTAASAEETARTANYSALVFAHCEATVTIQRSTVGAIEVNRNEANYAKSAPAPAKPAKSRTTQIAQAQTAAQTIQTAPAVAAAFALEGALEPITLFVVDSIVDSGGTHCSALSGVKRGDAPRPAFVRACFVRSTVFGSITTHELARADDSIFTGTVFVARRQTGCVRFCYLPTNSRTPSRYRCQPDIVRGEAAEAFPQNAESVEQAERSVTPIFESRRWGDPGYAYLTTVCSDAIRAGASDEGEMGVFHDGFALRKERALAERLAEFVPAGWESGVFVEIPRTPFHQKGNDKAE